MSYNEEIKNIKSKRIFEYLVLIVKDFLGIFFKNYVELNEYHQTIFIDRSYELLFSIVHVEWLMRMVNEVDEAQFVGLEPQEPTARLTPDVIYFNYFSILI